ncbi:MAG TPA: hypothetical protein VK915_02705 [Gaiellaceae bacterium]|nr:hypothetical protein [Gaiellaceae bacterium]
MDTAPSPLGRGLFFASLIALVLWLYDRLGPVHDARFEHAAA